MSEFKCPPDEFTDPDLPLVFLAGHETGHDWQSGVSDMLLRSAYAMNVASPRRHPLQDTDVMARIEDARWSLRHMRVALATGVLAVNLEPLATKSEAIDEQIRLFGIDRALSGGGLYRGNGNNIVVRVAPNYRGHEDYIGYLAGEASAIVVQEEAEFIAQILTRLPSPTRPILS